MANELKSCPFCGGHALYIEERAFVWNSPNNVFLAVRCTECGCRTKGVKVNGIDSDNEQKAMAAVEWNRRAEDAPTVDAIPVVHGRWEGQLCSVCNESYMDYADADSYPAIGEPKPNYCPNCGAKMDGDGNG